MSPKREVVPDCYNKLFGRGFWVKPEKKTLKLLAKSKKLSAFFEGEVFFDPNMDLIVKKLLMGKIFRLAKFFYGYGAKLSKIKDKTYYLEF